MAICPYTDTEWDNLPHVILKADIDWDLTVIAHESENGKEWFEAMLDQLDIVPDPFFDDVGDYKHVHHVTEAMVDSNLLVTYAIDYQDLLLLHNQNVTHSKVNYSQFQSKLAWLPVDIIEKTFSR